MDSSLKTAIWRQFGAAIDMLEFASEYKDYALVEMLMYNMRHVQHHTAQLNLLLRRELNDAPDWVSRTKAEL